MNGGKGLPCFLRVVHRPFKSTVSLDFGMPLPGTSTRTNGVRERRLRETYLLATPIATHSDGLQCGRPQRPGLWFLKLLLPPAVGGFVPRLGRGAEFCRAVQYYYY